MCSDVLARERPKAARLVLDLVEVSYIEPESLPLFRELLDRKVGLTNCSRFVAEQLRQVCNGNRSQDPGIER